MLHPGQFAILKKPLQLSGYRSLPLFGGWVLSYHEGLDVYCLPKHSLLLLGVAWQALPGKAAPEEELAALSESAEHSPSDAQLMALEESWCGRYVLICGDRVFLDPCSLLPVFHSAAGIASDLSLLAEATGLPVQIYEPGKVMNWMPGPLTPYKDITRVLPSQIYHFESGETHPRPLTAGACPSVQSEEERVRVFADIFANALNNMQAKFAGRKLLLALTGGYDSRALFALAKYAGLDFDAFTLEYDGIYADDITLPQELCKRTGTVHHYIPRDHSRYKAALEEEYLLQTAGLIRDADRLSYAHGQYQELAAPYGQAALLRSSAWEIAVDFYGRSFDQDAPRDDFFDWFCVPEKSREKQSLAQYFDWRRRWPQPGLSAADAFYWEERAGCWLSAIEAGFDLLGDAISLQPANCRLLLTMLLGFPKEERACKEHQAKIIRYACPEIADVPFGGSSTVDETALSRMMHTLRRVAYRVKTRGVWRTLRLYGTLAKKKF